MTAACYAFAFMNSESVARRLDEASGRVRRLRLLRKHHPELARMAKRIPVRRFAEESFRGKHKKGDFDSRGLVLLTKDAVMYWDLGHSTRLEPYVFRPGDSTATLHTKEPYREGERVWIQLEDNGLSRYLQSETPPPHETTRALFQHIDAVLHESPTSA